MVQADCTVLQRLASTFEASRPVNLLQVASHDQMDMPLSILYTYGSMRSGAGVKSLVVNVSHRELHKSPLPIMITELTTVIYL